MKGRLISLFEAWAERYLCRCSARGIAIPDAGFVWMLDKLQRWHHGSYDRFGRFVPLQPSFNLERCTAPRVNLRLDEFGVAFRRLSELDQGLVVVAHFGEGGEYWAFLEQKKLSERLAEKRLKQAWFVILIECRRRGLV